MQKYYLDTCIWRDYFENRSDRFRPLGDWAFKLIKKIIEENNFIMISDLVEEELSIDYGNKEIENIFSIIPKELLIRISVSNLQFKEAINISRELKTPLKDTLHAILAKNNNAILITRDKHFNEIDFVETYKPEELI